VDKSPYGNELINKNNNDVILGRKKENPQQIEIQTNISLKMVEFNLW
jgi:hypothetical protein